MAITLTATKNEREIIVAGLTDPSVLPNSVAILRRVEKIATLLCSPDATLTLDHDDFEFLLDRFKRAENWNIAPAGNETPAERIKKITAVEDLLDEAYKSLS